MARFAATTARPAYGAIKSNTGADPIGYSPAYGGIPQVPSLLDIYGQTIGSNQKYLPALTQLGTSVSGANEEALLNNLRLALPGYDASVGKSMGNIGALQRGEIPTDVSNLLKQQASERGIATGLYNSPNANAALMAALGRTSLDLQGEGEKQMTALVGRTPQAQPFDISRMFLNPSDLYESQLLANMYRAAPVPKSAAEQLIADQMSGYNRGRANVPSYSPSYSGGGGGPSGGYVPRALAPRYDPINPPPVGARGPFEPTPTPYRGTYGNLQAGGGDVAGLEWDPEMGTYYNRFTGQYVPPDEGSDAWMTWGGANDGGDYYGGDEGYDMWSE